MLIIITGIIAAEFGRFWHLVRRSLYSTLSPWFWASGAGPRWGLAVRVRKWEHLFLCGAFLRRAPKPRCRNGWQGSPRAAQGGGDKRLPLRGRPEVLTLVWILLLTAVEAWQARLEKARAHSRESRCDRSRSSHHLAYEAYWEE